MGSVGSADQELGVLAALETKSDAATMERTSGVCVRAKDD